MSLKPYPDNPRRTTKKQLEDLGKSMKEFGDLSGIVFNIRDGYLISGHQRIKSFLERYGSYEVDKEKSVVRADDEEINYREVDWDEAKAGLARLAANHHGGEDDPMLVEKEMTRLSNLGSDLTLTGLPQSYWTQKKEKDLELNQIFEVVVECIDEKEQENIYNQLIEMNMKCRVLTL